MLIRLGVHVYFHCSSQRVTVLIGTVEIAMSATPDGVIDYQGY